jgi:hypothetical protein
VTCQTIRDRDSVVVCAPHQMQSRERVRQSRLELSTHVLGSCFSDFTISKIDVTAKVQEGRRLPHDIHAAQIQILPISAAGFMAYGCPIGAGMAYLARMVGSPVPTTPRQVLSGRS